MNRIILVNPVNLFLFYIFFCFLRDGRARIHSDVTQKIFLFTVDIIGLDIDKGVHCGWTLAPQISGRDHDGKLDKLAFLKQRVLIRPNLV